MNNTFIRDYAGPNQHSRIYDNPAHILQPFRQHIIHNIYTNQISCFDGNRHSQIRNPYKKITSQFFRRRSHHSTGARCKFSNNITIGNLPGDQQNHTQQSGYKKNTFKIVIQPAQRIFTAAFFSCKCFCHTTHLSK